MTGHLVHNNYGKSRVRLLKVDRSDDRHEIQNLAVDISLEGEFDDIHLTGDNSMCLPTDTMKNTVYTLAADSSEIESIEAFGTRLAEHFLSHNRQIARVRITLAEHRWDRLALDGVPHPSSFVRGSSEQRTAQITATRDAIDVEGGLDDLVVLRTAGSGFAGFIKDELTTLPETSDRIFSTAIKASWHYSDRKYATDETFHAIRQTILEIFAEHDSHSVQHTLYAIGQAMLDRFAGIDEIAFSLPNIHCLPFDVTRFGRQDRNAIFVPTDEPFGLIEARLSR